MRHSIQWRGIALAMEKVGGGGRARAASSPPLPLRNQTVTKGCHEFPSEFPSVQTTI